MSSTVGDSAPVTGTGDRLGLKPGMIVQELGWDNDTDDELRVAVEDCIDADMVDGDYGNVVDAVLLWWRDDDGAWTGVAAPAVFLWTVRTTPDHRRSGTPDTGGTA